MSTSFNYQTSLTPPSGDNTQKVVTTAFINAYALRGDLAQSLSSAFQTQMQANLGLGGMALQSASGVAITGGSINGLSIMGVKSTSNGGGFGGPWGANGQIFSYYGNASGGNSGGIGMKYDPQTNVGYIGALAPGAAWIGMTFQAGVFSFQSNGGTQGLFQDSSGKVGVGTASPGYNLDVSGTGRLTGALIVGGTLTLSGNPALADNSTLVPNTAFLTSAVLRADLAQSFTLAQQIQLRANLGVTRTPVADQAYTVKATDVLVALTSLSAARVLTLPAAASYPAGVQLLIVDESGSCSATNTLTVQVPTPASGQSADTINGLSTAVLASAYAYLALESNGSGKWTIVDQSTLSMAQQSAAAVAITGGTIVGANVYSPFLRSGGLSGNLAASAPLLSKVVNTGQSLLAWNYTNGGGEADLVLNRGSGTAGGLNVYDLSNSGAMTLLMGLDGTGALSTAGPVKLPSYTVANLPAAGTAGRMVYCTNCRVFNGLGVMEAAGSGTGGLVTDNGSVWRVAGTNVAAAA